MQLSDAHNDLLMTFNASADVARYLRFCQNNNVTKLFAAYYFDEVRDNRDKDAILADVARKFAMVDNFDFVTTTLENIGFVDNLTTLNKLIKFHPFCASLTWNYQNKLAGGALSNAGMTKLGRRVAQELSSNNILVDMAHLNERSFWELAEIVDTPFCSHTASFEVYGIKRNLNKQQLKLIHERNGFVGLCLYNSLLCGVIADFDIIRRHLDNLLDYAGEDCVGLGTDFNGTGEQNPKGFLMDYSGMQDLIECLSKFYSQSTLQKIFCDNLKNLEARVRAKAER